MDNKNAITPLIQSYTVDFAGSNNFLFVKGIQGDGHSTRYVDIALLNDTQPYEINPDAVRVVIRGTKPDQTAVFNECEILNNNTIRVEITQQMSAAAGKGNYEISIMAKEENRTLTSFPFFVMISRASFDIGYVTSSDEFRLLIEKINEVNKMKEELVDISEDALEAIRQSKEQTEDCREATEDSIEATAAMRELHNAVLLEEEKRTKNDEDRQRDTAAALAKVEKATDDAKNQTRIMQELEQTVTEAETERIAAENARKEQAAAFSDEEDIRKANEALRIQNENKRQEREQVRVDNENLRRVREEKRQADMEEAINETIYASNSATAAASYAKSVGDDLITRLNRGEFKGEKGNDGVVHTIAGQYAFQIVGEDLILFYTDGDDPLDFQIDEAGDLILTIDS